MTDLAKLRELLAAATPGPWEWNGNWLWSPAGNVLYYTAADDGIHAANPDDPALIVWLVNNAEALLAAAEGEWRPIEIVFDGPPGPQPGRFVEVEDGNGNSISIGQWFERPDGNWGLRIGWPSELDTLRSQVETLRAENERLRGLVKWLREGYREMSRWSADEAAERTRRYSLDTLSGPLLSALQPKESDNEG